MKIQSLSIVVPTKRCVNNCKFCVSKMHDHIEGDYEINSGFNKNAIIKRLKYAVSNGITSCIITGTGEPLQNREYLISLAGVFDQLDHPFPNVELQTTGVLLDKLYNNRFVNIDLLRKLRVNTISLSVSDLFDDDNNMEIIGMPKKSQFKLKERIFWLKINGFNVRLSLNMNKNLNDKPVEDIFKRLVDLNVDQVTFRELWYDSNVDLPETKWVLENDVDKKKIETIKDYIGVYGEALYKLPYGQIVYSVDGMSTIIDDDCMADNDNLNLKYIILQSDNRLYCRWDDKGSLIF